MQRVAYHRLAAAELLESARFYDQRRERLGDEFLTAVATVLEMIRLQLRLLTAPLRGRCRDSQSRAVEREAE
jgi:hypothetical protein